MGVIFGELLLSHLASTTRYKTHVTFRFPSRTRCCIKVIYTTSGFAETERQMVIRNKLEIWVNFRVAAPRPWGENQKSNPPIALSRHTVK